MPDGKHYLFAYLEYVGDDFKTRRRAAKVLAMIKDERALPTLIERFTSDYDPAYWGIMLAMNKMAADDQKVKGNADKALQSEEVKGVENVTSNTFLAGLVRGGAGLAKAGAAVVNFIGGLFGKKEPVIDTASLLRTLLCTNRERVLKIDFPDGIEFVVARDALGVAGIHQALDCAKDARAVGASVDQVTDEHELALLRVSAVVVVAEFL